MMIFLLVLFVGSFLYYNERKGRCELLATCNMCDASEAFDEWRVRNQGVYIGLSEQGRTLAGKYLVAYEEFLRTHKYIDGKKHREWIVKQIYDFPPKYPDGVPGVDKKGVQLDALSHI